MRIYECRARSSRVANVWLCGSRTSPRLYQAEPTGDPTPGNPFLDPILENVAEPGDRWAPGGDFQQALAFLDRNHPNISPTEQLRVALALKLDVVGAIFRQAGLAGRMVASRS